MKDFYEITKFKLSLANTLVAIPLFIQATPVFSLTVIPFTLAT